MHGVPADSTKGHVRDPSLEWNRKPLVSVFCTQHRARWCPENLTATTELTVQEKPNSLLTERQSANDKVIFTLFNFVLIAVPRGGEVHKFSVSDKTRLAPWCFRPLMCDPEQTVRLPCASFFIYEMGMKTVTTQSCCKNRMKSHGNLPQGKLSVNGCRWCWVERHDSLWGGPAVCQTVLSSLHILLISPHKNPGGKNYSYSRFIHVRKLRHAGP